MRTRVVWRPSLAAGARIEGPAVIEEPNATTLIHPGDVRRRCRMPAISSSTSRPIDGDAMSRNEAHPITVEVVRNAIVAYADEMANALMKSAYNMMIYEVRDYCCGLIDTQARMISQNRGGLPIFLADLGVAVADGIARYGLDGFKPGDVVIMNQGEVCGQHLNNVVVYSPCFHDGELVGFAANRAHWVDIGGMHQGFGSSGIDRNLCRRPADPLAEDLRGGQAQRDAVADHPRQRALSGCEPRRPARADRLLPARRAALCRTDRALWPRHGRSLHRQGLGPGRAARRAASSESIPDGRYEAESFLDNDGRNLDKPLRVKVKVQVAGLAA